VVVFAYPRPDPAGAGETTEKMRGLDTPAENAGYPGLATAEPGRGSTGFFNILLIYASFEF
jgi:hypothetical protein